MSFRIIGMKSNAQIRSWNAQPVEQGKLNLLFRDLLDLSKIQLEIKPVDVKRLDITGLRGLDQNNFNQLIQFFSKFSKLNILIIDWQALRSLSEDSREKIINAIPSASELLINSIPPAEVQKISEKLPKIKFHYITEKRYDYYLAGKLVRGQKRRGTKPRENKIVKN